MALSPGRTVVFVVLALVVILSLSVVYPNASTTNASALRGRGDSSALPDVAGSASSRSGDRSTAAAQQWTWTESSVRPAPSARAGAATIFDPAAGFTLLFGGCPYWGGNYWGHNCTALGDTWALENGAWTNLTSSLLGASPPPRVDAGIAYDSTDGYVVMFGGFDGRTLYNDTWIFTGGHWSQAYPTANPSPRFAPGMAEYNPGQGVVLFGGTNWTTQFNDTWTYLAGQWSHILPARAPEVRFSSAMAYDPADASVLLFGGWSIFETQSYDDTWSFAQGTWTEVSSLVLPPPRNYASMAYDPGLNAMVMTGGHQGENVSSATWAFNSTSGWALIPTQNAPAPRWGQSLSYDPTSQLLWLFGGYVAYGNPPIGEYFGDTWAFGPVATPPPALYAVTFTEAGLPAGTAWSVTFGGVTENGTGTTIAFQVANGSYSYSVASVSGYSVVPLSGTQLVSGPGASITVTFTANASSSSAAFLEGGVTGGAIVGAILAVAFYLRPKRPPASGPLS